MLLVLVLVVHVSQRHEMTGGGGSGSLCFWVLARQEDPKEEGTLERGIGLVELDPDGISQQGEGWDVCAPASSGQGCSCSCSCSDSFSVTVN